MSDAPSGPKKRTTTQISIWCTPQLVRAIDKKCAELQEDRLARVHRSDVVREILEKVLLEPPAPAE